mgnify:CR=1 FL=1
MKKSLLVAEVAQAHEGSINLAITFINLVKEAGYDAVKFQIHLTEFETTYDDKFRKGTLNYNKSRFEYWKKMELSEQEWIKLSSYAKKIGLEFICSIFCTEAIDILNKLPNLHSVKISSGEMYNKNLILSLKNLNKPLLISTGMADTIEIKKLLGFLKNNKIKNYKLLHCVSSYPTKLADANLKKIIHFKKTLGINMGYSDHTGDKTVIMSAIAIQSPIIENHICIDRKIIGPDTTSSITPKDMKEISNFNKNFNFLFNGQYSRNNKSNTKNIKKLFSKSLSLNKDIQKGKKITEDDLALKKPGTGISVKSKRKFIGKIAKHNLSKHKLLKLSDVLK